jgi:hypothetical protein
VKIVVNHLTRMQQGYICVSGLKLGTCHHVRPILSGNQAEYEPPEEEWRAFRYGCDSRSWNS